MNLEQEKEFAAKEAVKLLTDNMIVGLGTGSSSVYAIREIAKLVSNGLKIKAVPTSNKTKELAEALNIPLIDINLINSIDITIDGADEFTSDLILIKGGGGALLREKIVASLTKQEIIIADSSKEVKQIGKFKVPIEVIPFASNYILSQIKILNGIGKIRMEGDRPFKTDQAKIL